MGQEEDLSRACRGGQRMSLLLAALAIAATSAPVPRPAPPQDAQKPPIIIGTEVEIVSVPVLVFDKAGRFIPDLKKQDIQIFEDGHHGHAPNKLRNESKPDQVHGLALLE